MNKDSNYRDRCIEVMKGFFPWLTTEQVKDLVDRELNKECIVYQIFPIRKLEEFDDKIRISKL